jgi:hypothetical protein
VVESCPSTGGVSRIAVPGAGVNVSLETRVDALAHEVASLRTEMREWAAIAMAAHRKADRNFELMKLIYQELQEIKRMLRPDMASLGAPGGAGRERILCRGYRLHGDE